MTRIFRSALAIAALCAPAYANAQMASASATGTRTYRPADLIMVNGRIYTVDDSRPMVSALAIRDGRVVLAASDGEVRALAGPRTRVIDVGGGTVIPGMVDAHAHLLGLGSSLRNVNLAGSKSYEEVIARVVERGKTMKPGEWIIGRGWDQNLWPVKEFPNHEALTRAFPANPVVLTRIDGHALLANAMALRAANITTATRDPEGGRIIRNGDNSPAGVFVDNAQGLVGAAIPDATEAQTRSAIL
ncbi:MAG: amidohydrolase family protein, partial [Gemmatimonadales bacterium]